MAFLTPSESLKVLIYSPHGRGSTVHFRKDARSEKKAIPIQTIGMFLLPFIWIIPPMMAPVWHPDTVSEFPK